MYRYRLFRAEREGAPTVIVVPGGPGSDIMRSTPNQAFALGAVSTEFANVIYADARGSGCNAYGPLEENNDQVYRTESVARDLLEIVRHEELDDYFLYGASFGSAAATVAAALAVEDGLPSPRRLILEGALGTAFASFEAYFATWPPSWRT